MGMRSPISSTIQDQDLEEYSQSQDQDSERVKTETGKIQFQFQDVSENKIAWSKNTEKIVSLLIGKQRFIIHYGKLMWPCNMSNQSENL